MIKLILLTPLLFLGYSAVVFWLFFQSIVVGVVTGIVNWASSTVKDWRSLVRYVKEEKEEMARRNSPLDQIDLDQGTSND